VVLGAFGVWMGFPLADPLIGLVITVAILAIVWQSAKAVLRRMLDGVEPGIVRELRHTAEHESGVKGVESVRARWLGHRLHAEMTLAVDPALSLMDVRKLADNIRGHAHGHLAALERLHLETVPASGRKRPDHHPHAEHQHHTEPPTSSTVPTRCRQLSVLASSPMKRFRAKAAASSIPPMVAIVPSAMAADTPRGYLNF
jgi:Dimerisation domain of Zinc Transporter